MFVPYTNSVGTKLMAVYPKPRKLLDSFCVSFQVGRCPYEVLREKSLSLMGGCTHEPLLFAICKMVYNTTNARCARALTAEGFRAEAGFKYVELSERLGMDVSKYYDELCRTAEAFCIDPSGVAAVRERTCIELRIGYAVYDDLHEEFNAYGPSVGAPYDFDGLLRRWARLRELV